MSEANLGDADTALERIHAQAAAESIRITQHAHQEMAEDDISLDELLEALTAGQILENYAEHRRGPCCLLNGVTDSGQPIHIVCTTAQPTLIIITVYVPKPPKWVTPTQRRR
jgi:hypothetical protein